MILADTGPLVALADRNDPHRERTTSIVASVTEPMLTTEACLTEALYLLHRAGGWQSQLALWSLIHKAKILSVHTPSDTARISAAGFMERFRDQPCDYADATLLVAAEDTGIRRIFTLDRHFLAYRLASGESLDTLE